MPDKKANTRAADKKATATKELVAIAPAATSTEPRLGGAMGTMKDGNFTGMPQNDLDFLVACLRNTVGGSIVINTKGAAEMLEYKNHRSITNRIKQMRDKYGIAMSGTTKGTTDGPSAFDKDIGGIPGELVETESFSETDAKNTAKTKVTAPKSVTAKKPAAKNAPAKKAAPVTKKRKLAEEVTFPGLATADSGADADISGTEKDQNTPAGSDREDA